MITNLLFPITQSPLFFNGNTEPAGSARKDSVIQTRYDKFRPNAHNELTSVSLSDEHFTQESTELANGYKLRFIQDDSVKQTEVIIRAKTQDEEVERILSALGEDSRAMLLCETLSSSRLIDKNDIVIISKDGRYLSVKTVN